MVDASHIRAHQHATGFKDQAISRSIDGNSTKIHLALDSNGNSIQFLIHDGTTHDMKVAPALVNEIDLTDTDVLSADRLCCTNLSLRAYSAI